MFELASIASRQQIIAVKRRTIEEDFSTANFDVAIGLPEAVCCATAINVSFKLHKISDRMISEALST